MPSSTSCCYGFAIYYWLGRQEFHAIICIEGGLLLNSLQVVNTGHGMLTEDKQQELQHKLSVTHSWFADFSAFKTQPQDTLMSWLLDQGSTTQRFARLGVNIEIDLLEEKHGRGFSASAYRMVRIKAMGSPVMLASSWLYASDDSKYLQDFVGLGGKSLGEMLFSGNSLWQRSAFEYYCVEQESPTNAGKDTMLWARRSDFIQDASHRLHLVEIFLPQLLHLNKKL